MTAVRWVTEHRPDQIGGPDWLEHPDEAAAITAAGTAGKVWALVPPEAVRVLEAAQAWRLAAAGEKVSDNNINAVLTASARFVDALTRLAGQEPTR